MPELPDLEIYREALARCVVGRPLERLEIVSPFVLRSVEIPPEALAGREVTGTRRLGKRLVLALAGGLFAVLHLRVGGRLHWKKPVAKGPGRIALAAFRFEHGALWFTEAAKKKRASLHLVAGDAALAEHDPGGVEPLAVSPAELAAALRRENRTLKRALTDPRLVAGIGNAYSDEILFRARLSPAKRSADLDDEELDRLVAAIRAVLAEWIERLRTATGDGFPERVTAFRPEMAVHGRFGRPGPVCGSPVQRIVFAENEANYCAACQTGGRLLADRALSRLLHGDWPRSLDELEEMKERHRAP